MSWRGDLERGPPRDGSFIISPYRRVGEVLVDGRRRCRVLICCIADLVAMLLLVLQWCRALVDALVMLHTGHNREKRPESEKEQFEDLSWIQTKVEDLPGRKDGIYRAPWALPVADPPTKELLHPSCHLPLRDLALYDPGGVGLPLVFKGRVGLILNGLD
jgi:hypothetical protein